jgi:ferredoxin--NADP+ reductase
VRLDDHASRRERALKVAIVGAGPSGLFAAEGLVDRLGTGVDVDVLDRLPTPYGLVRYGVAPDHPTIKSVVNALQAILEVSNVRFLGGIEVGTDLPITDLARCYDAIVYATGAPRTRCLGIPGETLKGSVSASDLVNWYNGHPDTIADFDLQAKSVAVLGAGNVALDLARILTRDYTELAQTDIPSPVLERLRHSAVHDVHLIARRGPEFAKFSSKELRELGKIDGIHRTVERGELAAALNGNFDRATAAKIALFDSWSTEPSRPHARNVHFRFSLRPVEIVGTTHVEGLILERTAVNDRGLGVGTGDFVSIPVQLVVAAVGYHGAALPDVPFDDRSGTVPNRLGRVCDAIDGPEIAGQYVTGWLKRGPVGVIGTNKVDSHETISALIDDCSQQERPPRESIDSVLDARGHPWIPYAGWQNIDRAEISRGAAEGRSRSKISDWRTLKHAAMNPGAAMSVEASG